MKKSVKYCLFTEMSDTITSSMVTSSALDRLPLIRILSEHHWRSAKTDLIQENKTRVRAGESGVWDFWVVRDNPETHSVHRVTTFNGKVVLDKLDDLYSLDK